MAFTLLQLRTDLQAHGYGTDSASAQTAAINAGLRDMRNWRRWPWDRVELFDDLDAGTFRSSNLDFGSITAVYCKNPTLGDANRLTYAETDEIYDRYYQDPNYRARPQLYALEGKQIIVWPVADIDYQLRPLVSTIPQKLVNDGDVIDLPDTYMSPIVWGALKHLAYRARDWDALDVAETQFTKTLLKIAANVGLNQAGETTEVERSGFYDIYSGPVGII